MTTPTITIAGPTGSGKTTIAIAVFDALRALGIPVVLNDIDAIAGYEMRHLQGARLEALREAWASSGPVAIYTALPDHETLVVRAEHAAGEVSC